MPLVFVHGVATRLTDDDNERRRILERDNLFHTLVFKQPNCLILNPYWGELGAKPNRQWSSLPSAPQGRTEIFKATTEPAGESRYLAPLAEEDMSEAIDVLFGTIFERYIELDEDIPNDVVAAAWTAAQYAAALDQQRDPQRSDRIPLAALPDWLDNKLTDEEFAMNLSMELGLTLPQPAKSKGWEISESGYQL
jgi:hypothetical protein